MSLTPELSTAELIRLLPDDALVDAMRSLPHDIVAGLAAAGLRSMGSGGTRHLVFDDDDAQIIDHETERG